MIGKKHARIFILVGTLLAVYFTYAFIDQQGIMYRKQGQMNELQKMKAAEEKYNRQLKKQQEQVDSDEFIEKYAREKLKMVKPGEKIFIDGNQ